jgi:hypothetical protein
MPRSNKAQDDNPASLQDIMTAPITTPQQHAAAQARRRHVRQSIDEMRIMKDLGLTGVDLVPS